MEETSSFVVFVHGVGIFVDVVLGSTSFMKNQAPFVTLYFLLKEYSFLTKVSPNRLQPNLKIVKAAAHIAASLGMEVLMLALSSLRCSIETGARLGRLKKEPSFFAVVLAISTHLSSPYQGA
jgi:hypothetical protein